MYGFWQMDARLLCTASVTINLCCLSYWILRKILLLTTRQVEGKAPRSGWQSCFVGREECIAKMVTETLWSLLLGGGVIFMVIIDSSLWSHPFATSSRHQPFDMTLILLAAAAGKNLYCVFFQIALPARPLRITYNIITVFYLAVSLVLKENLLLSSAMVIVDIHTLFTQGYFLFKGAKYTKFSSKNARSLAVAASIACVANFIFLCFTPSGFFLYALVKANPIQMTRVSQAAFFIGVVCYGTINCWLLCMSVSELRRRILTVRQGKGGNQKGKQSTVFRPNPGIHKKLYGANLVSFLMNKPHAIIDMNMIMCNLNNNSQNTRPPTEKHPDLRVTKNKI